MLGGGGEFWLTEFGCLTYPSPQIISDNLDWMENNSGVNRYAWFHIGSGTSQYAPTFTTTPDYSNFSLTDAGIKYAEYPTIGLTNTPSPSPTPILGTPTNTPSPTNTPILCANRDKGNINCDNDVKIDINDLNILLTNWTPPGSVSSPVPLQISSDLNNDNKVDSSKL